MAEYDPDPSMMLEQFADEISIKEFLAAHGYIITKRNEVRLENPERTITALRQASSFLSVACVEASYREGDQTNLNGPVRDIIFGLNSAVDSLAEMIAETQGATSQSDLAFACRCGETHRGPYAAYDYGHHNCFHTEPLVRVVPDEDPNYLLCPQCGATFSVVDDRE